MAAEAPLAVMRWARGCRCFVSCGGDQVRAYGWLSAGPEWIGEAAVEIRPGAGEGYVWNCVTLTPHRRQGLFTSLVGQIAVQARAEGFERLWIAGIDGTAEKGMAAVGYVPVMHIEVWRMGLLRRLRLTTAEGAPVGLPTAAHGVLNAPRLALNRRRRH